MKKTITQYLYMDFWYTPDFSRQEWTPAVRSHKWASDEKQIYIGPIQIEVEIPDDFNPVPQQVAALEKKKAEALAAYQATVAEINERLSKLQAIAFEDES